MSARVDVLHCHDLVCHLLGFVGDKDKVLILSYVNKTFDVAVKDAASWKWGSNGFIIQHPSRERLRLLRMVSWDYTGIVRKAPAGWLRMCPALVDLKLWRLLHADTLHTYAAIAPRLERLLSYDKSLVSAVIATRAPRLHTLVAWFLPADLNALPALTDLTLHGRNRGTGFVLPLVARTLRRLVINTNVQWAHSLTESPPWNLRELSLQDTTNVSSADVVAICALCPNLVSLCVDRALVYDELEQVAQHTPLLEVFAGALDEQTIDADGALAERNLDGADVLLWPRLSELTLTGSLERVLGNLASPQTLHKVTIKSYTSLGLVDSTHHYAQTLAALRVLARAEVPLTMFVINTHRNHLRCGIAMHDFMTTVGNTLTKLHAPVNLADVARYCPRMRELNALFDVEDTLRWETTRMDLIHGCPLLPTPPLVLDDDGCLNLAS
jgi:hypothetical protein